MNKECIQMMYINLLIVIITLKYYKRCLINCCVNIMLTMLFHRTVTPQQGNDVLSPPFCKGYIYIYISNHAIIILCEHFCIHT